VTMNDGDYMGHEAIIEKVLKYDPNADRMIIEKAYKYAQMAHNGQKRISGEPFIIHPVEVGNILTSIEMDTGIL
jgi:guanosine-3',5'-bis(diphosphate) 3'-pyrophosphohydrolase